MDVAAVVNGWIDEGPALLGARARAAEIGLETTSAEAGATLRMLAALVGARTVVETGTGVGISALCLLAGMPTGTLTSIDLEPEHQRLARLALLEAQVAPTRFRLITGTAADMLPRLSDGGYDLVHLDDAPLGYQAQLAVARRLVRPGGLLVLSGVLRHAGEASSRDPEATALRGLLAMVRADESLDATLLTVGRGLLVLRPLA